MDLAAREMNNASETPLAVYGRNDPCAAIKKAGVSCMRLQIASLIAILGLSGCAPAALLPAQAAAGLVQSMDSTASTFLTGESSARLNGANVELARAQTRLTLGRVTATSLDARRVSRERTVTARLLRQMSHTYHNPLLETLAEWVEGGGDPDFAFKYALVQVNPTVSQVKVIPPQPGLAIGRGQPINLGAVAHSPQACPAPLPSKPSPKNSGIVRPLGQDQAATAGRA
jgi:hypothetical protein